MALCKGCSEGQHTSLGLQEVVSEGRKSFPLLSSALLNQSSERPMSFRSNQDATGVSSSLKKYQNHYETSNSRARGSSGSSESQDHLCLWASAFFPRAFYGCHHVDPDVTPAPPLVFTHPGRRQQLPHTRHESAWQRTVRERDEVLTWRRQKQTTNHVASLSAVTSSETLCYSPPIKPTWTQKPCITPVISFLISNFPGPSLLVLYATSISSCQSTPSPRKRVQNSVPSSCLCSLLWLGLLPAPKGSKSLSLIPVPHHRLRYT